MGVFYNRQALVDLKIEVWLDQQLALFKCWLNKKTAISIENVHEKLDSWVNRGPGLDVPLCNGYSYTNVMLPVGIELTDKGYLEKLYTNKGLK